MQTGKESRVAVHRRRDRNLHVKASSYVTPQRQLGDATSSQVGLTAGQMLSQRYHRHSVILPQRMNQPIDCEAVWSTVEHMLW